jgi:CO/xanthine dehydrogenase Mo-binding subunit
MSLAGHPLVGHWIGARDGRLLVHTGKVDIGQRISTALMQIAHEELTVPHDMIDVAPVRTGHAPDEGITSGSNSLEQSGNALRRAAATVRGLLVAQAVDRFGGAPADWKLEDGALHLPGTNHRLAILDLVKEIDAAVPVDPDAPFLDGAAAGPPAMRGIADVVAGRFVFVHDLDVAGMMHARVIRPPHARARLDAVDPAAIARLQAKGMHLVRDGSFVAIAGPREWPVTDAALKLASACTWNPGDGLPETDVFAHLMADNATRFAVVDGVPGPAEIPDPLVQADLAARYERPYQMHGALAPSAAMARWDGGTLTIHSHSQGIYPLRASIADSLGLDETQVDITHVPGSGCYGHNGADDAAFEAALVAMALPGTPILLKWTREEEHAWEPYAPAMAVQLAAALDGERIIRFSAEAYSDTHRGRPRAGANRAGPAKLLANRFRADPIGPNPAQPNMGRHAGMHRNLDPIYAFPDKRLVKNLVSGLPHRTSAMRTLGATANVFAIESFLDELAAQAGVDGFAFRLAHLNDPRARAVLQELERQVARSPSPGESGGRGIAYAQYKNQMTRVGVCVDVAMTDRAEARLTRALIVADAGRVVDPDGLAAQLEGGFVQAASWALCEEVTWDRDGITSRDWDSYPVIRFDNIPDIEVTILDRRDHPSVGAGEATPGPTVAAIANAICDATGIRMRRMPFTPDAIMRAAMTG